MQFFLLTLIAPALWALSNHFDKFIVTRYFKDASLGAMMIFSALVGLAVLPVALLLQQQAFALGVITPIILILNGCLYLLAVQLYLVALRTSEVSSAVPILQLIPVISFVLAYFTIGEILSTNQMIGGGLITLGALIISLEPHSGRRIKWRADVLGLMSLSSFAFALTFLLFKVFALQTDFWSAMVWESFGFICFGIFLLIFVDSYRRDFFGVFGTGGAAPWLNLINEVINIIGKVCFNYVSTLTPITLAWVGVSFQPIFVLVYSVILSIFLPHICKENVLGVHFIHKAVSLGVMFTGAYILNR